MTTSAPGYNMTTEEFPLPKTRPDILRVIDDTLAKGMAQKLVIDVHKGVKVWRLVKSDNEMQELMDNDVMSAIRNAPMEEINSDLSPFELIFKLFASFTVKKVQPKSFIVQSRVKLREWLGITALNDSNDLYCIPVISHLEVPDDVLLLVGASADDIEEVVCSFKISMIKEGVKK